MLESKEVEILRISRQLTKMVDGGAIPHALIFHGREGSAKLALAHAFAQYIICNNRQDGKSCNKCTACSKALKMIHPDIHYVFPVIKKEGKKREDTTSSDFLVPWREAVMSNPYLSITDWMHHIGAENNQPNINTKECNEVIHKLNLQSFESFAKVLIVWLPEFLGKEGNRLLKIIEEPTDDTFIILVAEDLGKILATIISRTQLVQVPPCSDEEIIRMLVDKKGLDLGKASQLAAIADGNMTLALSMHGQQLKDYSSLLFQWIRLSYKSKPEDLIAFISSIADLGREGQKNFLQYGLNYFREYLYVLHTGQKGQRINNKEFEIAQKMKAIIDLPKLEGIISLLESGITEISRNANPRICFMAKSIQLGAVMKGEELSLV
jgi:DNA polymerase-3 subunit delta'